MSKLFKGFLTIACIFSTGCTKPVAPVSSSIQYEINKQSEPLSAQGVLEKPSLLIRKIYNQSSVQAGQKYVKLGSFSVKALQENLDISNIELAISNPEYFRNIRLVFVTAGGNHDITAPVAVPSKNINFSMKDFQVSDHLEMMMIIYGDVKDNYPDNGEYSLSIPILGITGKGKSGITYGKATGFSIKKPEVLMDF